MSLGSDFPTRERLHRRTRVVVSAVVLAFGGLVVPAAQAAPAPSAADVGTMAVTFADEFNAPIDWANGPWDPRTDVRGNSSQQADNVRYDPDVEGSDGAVVIDLLAEEDRGKPFTGGGLVFTVSGSALVAVSLIRGRRERLAQQRPPRA